MQDLIERIEAAEGPSRELDAEIWLATVSGATRKQWSYIHKASGRECHVDETRENGRLIIVPEYTSSIDAAMTLAPEGCLLMARTIWDANRNTAGLARIDIYSHKDGQKFWSEGFDAIAATLALALCAAALRARNG